MSTSLSVIVAAIAVIVALSGLHTIPEGHVGLYWRGGALMERTSRAGFHWKIPLLEGHSAVQVTVQTDSVTNIPCGTSGGVLIDFAKVEVVNRLRSPMVHATVKNYTVHYDQTWIFDKIHHEINQFCSAHTLQEVYIDLFDTLDEALALALQKDCNVWAPGIEIIAVRVTKPKIPTMIARNFESIEIEKTKLHIATAHQAVVEKEAETERKRATIDAEMLAAISTISMRKELAIKQSEQKIASLHDEIHLAKEKVRADAEHYRGSRLAEVNKARLTKAFLEYTHIQAMGNNSKVYFGEKIPSMYVERDESGLVHQ